MLNISSNECEAIWVEIKTKKLQPLYICSLYRPAARGCDIESVEKYKNYLISCFDKLPKNPEVYIIGDLNCDMLQKNNLLALMISVEQKISHSKLNLTLQVKSHTAS